MTKLLLMLLMVSVWSGCGGDSPTGEGGNELLIWTTNHDNGEIKEEYQYYNDPKNNKRIKNGWYNSYYEDREYKEVGTFKEDKKYWLFMQRKLFSLQTLIFVSFRNSFTATAK